MERILDKTVSRKKRWFGGNGAWAARSVLVGAVSGAGRDLDDEAIGNLDRAREEAPRRQICLGDACCRWRRFPGEDDPGPLLWPVIRSVAELLTFSRAARIRECAGPDCTWLFLDTRRGRRRRWCDMGTCGNRTKARGYYTCRCRTGRAW